MISKLFEQCLVDKFEAFTDNCDLQFRFKKKTGCSDAVFVFRQCIDYFVTRGSAVYVAALNAKKAFDRVNHVKLFIKLCHYGLPLPIIRLMFD